MSFTQKELDEFKEIYFNQTWIKLSNQEATENWLKLVNLLKVLSENKNIEN